MDGGNRVSSICENKSAERGSWWWHQNTHSGWSAWLVLAVTEPQVLM